MLVMDQDSEEYRQWERKHHIQWCVLLIGAMIAGGVMATRPRPSSLIMGVFQLCICGFLLYQRLKLLLLKK